MKQTIDARGLSCPEPLVLLQKGIRSGATDIIITVDNPVSLENIVRYAKGKYGVVANVTQNGDESSIAIRL